jgi:hypothetical protein
LVTTLDGRDAAGENKHDVLAELRHIPILAAAKTFSEADEKKQRPHAPGNSEHSEKRAQLVRPQRAQRLPDDID